MREYILDRVSSHMREEYTVTKYAVLDTDYSVESVRRGRKAIYFKTINELTGETRSFPRMRAALEYISGKEQ